MGSPAFPRSLWLLRLFLPVAFVERVVEPAYGDLSVELGRAPGPIAVAGLAISALWVGAPTVIWRRGRPTAVGGVVITLGVMALLVVYLRNSNLYS